MNAATAQNSAEPTQRKQETSGGKTPTKTGKPDSSSVLRVEGLKKHFPVHSGVLQRVAGQVKAVDGISDTIAETIYDFFHDKG